MIIVMKQGYKEPELDEVMNAVVGAGGQNHVIRGVKRTVVAVSGEETVLRTIPFETFAGVESAQAILKPYKLASMEGHDERSRFELAPGVIVGGPEIVLMAGPCSVECPETMHEIARGIKAAGCKVLRGGAFKPRTSPYDFQGLGEEGLKILSDTGREHGLATITEVMDTRDVELIERYVDIFQIGARNMQNFSLLKEVGRTRKPVVVKRGLAATIKEWIMCAEYILAMGNPRVLLCERGIRSFDPMTRNLFDAAAVAVAKSETHLPVIVDPSHAGGSSKWVEPISRAAVAIGADALLIEAHPHPEKATSDGAQTVRLDHLDEIINGLKPIAAAIGRSIG
jgi:3-deoxy-7-phosphoheptulonate synthase